MAKKRKNNANSGSNDQLNEQPKPAEKTAPTTTTTTSAPTTTTTTRSASTSTPAPVKENVTTSKETKTGMETRGSSKRDTSSAVVAVAVFGATVLAVRSIGWWLTTLV